MSTIPQPLVYTAFTFDQSVLQQPTFVGVSGRSSNIYLASPGLPDATLGVPYSCTLQVIGGTGPFIFNLTSGSLPSGLTLNTSTGVISGTPTGTGTSTATVSIKATDTFAVVGSSSFTLHVDVPSLPVVTADSLKDGTVGTAYSGGVSATGGTSPYTFAIISGSLPAGLSFNTSTGAITGTPTASGTSSFTVQVTDSTSATSSNAMTLKIAAADAPIITVGTLPNATIGIPYTTTLGVTEGVSPYTFAVTSGSLPAGISLNTSTGVISGTATTAGTSSFTISVTDSQSNSSSSPLTLTVSLPAGGNSSWAG